jgi:hypothetical protein
MCKEVCRKGGKTNKHSGPLTRHHIKVHDIYELRTENNKHIIIIIILEYRKTETFTTLISFAEQ